MPKSENSNQNSGVEPVLPPVDPSVLLVPDNETMSAENLHDSEDVNSTDTETVTETTEIAADTVENEVPVSADNTPVRSATNAESSTSAAPKAKKPHQPRTRKPRAKAEKVKAEEVKSVSTKIEQKISSGEADEDAPKHRVLYSSPVYEARLSRTRTNPTILALLIVSLLVSCASLAYCIWDFVRGDTPITFNYPGADGNSASFTEGSIAEVASKVTPGVVSIVTEVRTTGFFGQTSTSTAAGTGMIVTKDGYVLTNKHVIEGANSIQIVLDDGTTYTDIAIVGQDPSNDVAFLKIKNADNLPTVELGDSKTITAGQQVIAIGNALGQFQNTITSGIISGTGRAITATSSDYSSSESLTDLIQTDAAINAGNSGGPLVNAAGQVIGINTATSTEADGIGFAIPISSVKGMLKNIINNNSSDRAYLGVYYISITPDVAKAYNLPVSSGAYVYSPSQYSSVVVNGPADKAGLKDKDIITKINGIEVGKAGTVASLIGEYAPGDTIQLTVIREGKERAVNVTLGSYTK